MRTLAGGTAVVTGGGSGIGHGLCVVLARAGMRVVVSDIEEAAAAAVAGEIRASGHEAIPVRTDVSDLEDVQRLKSITSETFGATHVLCNNAGVSVRRRGIHASHEDWQWVLGINLWGVVHGIETFLPDMLASGEEGHIVNTSSMNGIVPSAFSAMYSASKYGVIGLTETLRNELVGSRIGISALCPAAVATRIGDAERNRPEVLRSSAPSPEHVPSSSFDLSPALTPEQVGELTVAGIRNDQLYIFTDMKVRRLIDQHHRRMVADFDHLATAEGRYGISEP